MASTKSDVGTLRTTNQPPKPYEGFSAEDLRLLMVKKDEQIIFLQNGLVNAQATIGNLSKALVEKPAGSGATLPPIRPTPIRLYDPKQNKFTAVTPEEMAQFRDDAQEILGVENIGGVFADAEEA